MTQRSEWSSAPLRATISALSLRTRTTARRTDTTQRGSKLALSSRALPKPRIPPGARAAGGSGRSLLGTLAGPPLRFESVLGAAPAEVRHQVGAARARVGVAVLGLEPEPEVAAIRPRHERRPTPPARRGEAAGLTERHRPQRRPGRDREPRGDP